MVLMTALTAEASTSALPELRATVQLRTLPFGSSFTLTCTERFARE